MKDYQYQELIDIVKRMFCHCRKAAAKIGENTIQSLERFFYNYDCVIEEGDCEAAIICSTLCVELSQIQEKTISKRQYDKLMFVLQQYDSSKIVDSISESEIELLNKQVKEAIGILEKMKIES